MKMPVISWFLTPSADLASVSALQRLGYCLFLALVFIVLSAVVLNGFFQYFGMALPYYALTNLFISSEDIRHLYLPTGWLLCLVILKGPQESEHGN